MIVYLAVNRVNGKAYVGQTISTPRERMWRHIFNKPVSPFQHALRKYGAENFDACVLEQCTSKAELDEREKHWISHLGCRVPVGYNLALGGGGALGIEHPHLGEFNRREDVRQRRAERMRGEGNHFFGKTHTPETREKMARPRPSMQGRKRPDVSARLSGMVGPLNPAFGKKHTEEENKRNSELLSGARNPRFGKTWTPEQRKKISDGVKAAWHRPEVKERFLLSMRKGITS